MSIKLTNRNSLITSIEILVINYSIFKKLSNILEAISIIKREIINENRWR
jgi:hypothetical protein